MKKIILISTLSLFALIACKKDPYPNDRPSTFSFDTKIMNVEVSKDVTSFFVSGTIIASDKDFSAWIAVQKEKSTAKENVHFIMPSTNTNFWMDFITGMTKSKMEIKIKPENIEVPLTLVLSHGHYMALDEKYINEITINLIPTIE